MPVTQSVRPKPTLRWTDPHTPPAGDYAASAIPNAELDVAAVPQRGESWEAVSDFALSYDGYAYWDDLSTLAGRVLQRWTRRRTLPDTLDELRGCLFYEQRRWHHFGEVPTGRSAEYMWAMVAAIGALALPSGSLRPLAPLSSLSSSLSVPLPPAHRPARRPPSSRCSRGPCEARRHTGRGVAPQCPRRRSPYVPCRRAADDSCRRPRPKPMSGWSPRSKRRRVRWPATRRGTPRGDPRVTPRQTPSTIGRGTPPITLP